MKLMLKCHCLFLLLRTTSVRCFSVVCIVCVVCVYCVRACMCVRAIVSVRARVCVRVLFIFFLFGNCRDPFQRISSTNFGTGIIITYQLTMFTS
jgi:hypothetical protein